jgi:hypothetical protein
MTTSQGECGPNPVADIVETISFLNRQEGVEQ